MANDTDFQSGFIQNLDLLLDLRIRLVVVAASVAVMSVIGVSFIVLNRTRHTPRTARFLSSTLLVFDFIAALMYAIRKLVEDVNWNYMFQLSAMGFSFLGYINIAIMSVERLVVFHWPNFYLRKVTFSPFRKLCYAIWVTYESVWAFECIACYTFIGDSKRETAFCFTSVLQRHMRFVFLTTTTIACLCLIKISFIIASQSKKTSGKMNTRQNNRSTVVVFICIINYVVTTICVFAITFLIKEVHIRRMCNDLLMLANGLVDTCAYVLWFRECRLELLKILSCLFPSLKTKAEEMRIRIFDISTFDKQTLSQK